MFGSGMAQMVLNPFGGAIADRFSKRMLILVSQVVLASVILTIAILIATDNIRILFLAIGSFITGSMFAVLGPSRTALLGDTVAEGRIGNAMALLQVGGNFARICSPFIAAALLVVVGASGTYFIIFGLFIFVLVTMYQLPSTSSRPNRGETSVFQDVRIGIRYLWTHPRLLHAVLNFYFMTMLGMSSIVLMPGFAKDTLDSGTAGLGLLLGVAAASGFVTSVSVASLADSRRAPALLTVSSLVAGAGLIATGLAPNLIVAAVVGMFVGGGTSVFQTLNNAVALRRSEPAFYGRVASLMMIAWGLTNVVSLPVGFLGDAVGERAAFATLGVSLCTMSLLFALWGRQIDRKAGVQVGV
jgi:MFS family permease